MSIGGIRPVTVQEVTEALLRRKEVITTHLVVMHDDINRSFKLPVGPCEALGIRVWLNNDLVARPLTHDLMNAVLERLGGEIEHMVIERNGDGWKTVVSLKTSTGSYTLESNHGDGIALALRANATIFATEEVITSGDQTV